MMWMPRLVRFATANSTALITLLVIAGAVAVEHAQRDDLRARRDTLVIALRVRARRRNEARDVRAVAVAVVRRHLHGVAVAEVVGGRDAEVVARRHAGIDHRDADVPGVPVGAAVAHRAAHDRELRSRITAGRAPAGDPRRAGIRRRLVRLHLRVDRDALDVGEVRQLLEVLVVHLRQHAADQLQRERAVSLAPLDQPVEVFRAPQVDARAGADDDAMAPAPLVRLTVDDSLQAPIELVEPGAARGATVTAPRLRRRDVRGDEPASNQTMAVDNWGDLMPTR